MTHYLSQHYVLFHFFIHVADVIHVRHAYHSIGMLDAVYGKEKAFVSVVAPEKISMSN